MRYDAGLLNDFGGGDVNWWQDYLRAELERSHDFYTDRIEFLEAALDGASKRLIEGGDFLAKEALVATIKALEADHEKAVALVIEASIATGHADTSADLMAEVLHKVGELRAENAALQQQIDGLQQRVHLCAGYDALEKENAALEEKLNKFRNATCANCGAGPATPPTTDKGYDPGMLDRFEREGE